MRISFCVFGSSPAAPIFLETAAARFSCSLLLGGLHLKVAILIDEGVRHRLDGEIGDGRGVVARPCFDVRGAGEDDVGARGARLSVDTEACDE